MALPCQYFSLKNVSAPFYYYILGKKNILMTEVYYNKVSPLSKYLNNKYSVVCKFAVTFKMYRISKT